MATSSTTITEQLVPDAVWVAIQPLLPPKRSIPRVGDLGSRAPAFSRFVPIVQSPHMTHEREATLSARSRSRSVESPNRTSGAFRENAGALPNR
jgi:hypothetical protein